MKEKSLKISLRYCIFGSLILSCFYYPLTVSSARLCPCTHTHSQLPTKSRKIIFYQCSLIKCYEMNFKQIGTYWQCRISYVNCGRKQEMVWGCWSQRGVGGKAWRDREPADNLHVPKSYTMGNRMFVEDLDKGSIHAPLYVKLAKGEEMEKYLGCGNWFKCSEQKENRGCYVYALSSL